MKIFNTYINTQIVYYFIIAILKLNQIEALRNNYFYDVMNPRNADVMYTENNV